MTGNESESANESGTESGEATTPQPLPVWTSKARRRRMMRTPSVWGYGLLILAGGASIASTAHVPAHWLLSLLNRDASTPGADSTPYGIVAFYTVSVLYWRSDRALDSADRRTGVPLRTNSRPRSLPQGTAAGAVTARRLAATHWTTIVTLGCLGLAAVVAISAPVYGAAGRATQVVLDVLIAGLAVALWTAAIHPLVRALRLTARACTDPATLQHRATAQRRATVQRRERPSEAGDRTVGSMQWQVRLDDGSRWAFTAWGWIVMDIVDGDPVLVLGEASPGARVVLVTPEGPVTGKLQPWCGPDPIPTVTEAATDAGPEQAAGDTRTAPPSTRGKTPTVRA